MKKQFLRRLLSLTLSAAMLGSVSITTANASSNDSTNQKTSGRATLSISTLLNNGVYTDATAGNTYTIANQTDMNTFIGYVNDGKLTQGVTFQLTGTGKTYDVSQVIAPATITEDSDTNSPKVASGAGFQGTFDGGSNTINVNLTGATSGMGLFGYLAPTGLVEDLTVTGSVTNNATTAQDAIGGVVGYNSGTIDHVTNQATVSATGCYNVGGIAGFNDCYYTNLAVGIITNCRNEGGVSGYSKVGGIAGENSGTVNACSNIAAITASNSGRTGIGGIVGRNGNNGTAVEAGVIANCYNTANITCSSGSWVGGICGFNNSLSKVVYCYDTGSMYGRSYTDPICGGNEGEKVTTCYYPNNINMQGVQGYDGAIDMTANSMRQESFVSTLNGGTTASNSIWQPKTSDYPVLLANGNATAVDMGFTIQKSGAPTTTYQAGQSFSTTGLTIQAVPTSSTGTTTTVTDSTVTPARVLTLADKNAHVYGVYKGVAYSFPFAITVTGSTGTSTIYLSSTGSDSNAGTTSDTAVATLGKAVELIGTNEGTILVMNTITIGDGRVFGNLNSENGDEPLITVKAADGATGSSMFNVTGTAYIGSLKFDGTGFPTTFSVSGTLAIRNNAVVLGSNTAFDVTSNGRLTLNRSNIAGTQYSVKVATDGYFEIGVASTQTFAMSGTIQLGEGTEIVFSDPVPCDLIVECTDTNVAAGRMIATGIISEQGSTGKSYSLTVTDADHLTDASGNYGVMRKKTTTGNTLVLANRLYLNGSAATGGNGTTNSPFNNLKDALDAAGTYDMIIAIGSASTIAADTYDKETTVQRGASLTGAMFQVGSDVTLQNIAFTGKGSGTVVNLTGGTLTLSDDATVTNCATAINQTGGSLTVNSATISGSDNSVYMGANATAFTLAAASGISIDGTIYLASGKYITATAAIPCDLTVQCASPAVGTVIAVGIGYSLTQTDADYVSEYTDAYGVMEVPETYGNLGNTTELLLVERIYLDGTKPDGGDGTKENPYNDLATALGVVNSRRKILVTGTTPLTSGTYSASMTATVQRGPELTGPMFTVDDGASVILSRFTITGRGTGTIVQVVGGTLDLKGGVELSNCDMAVDMVGGNVTVSQTVISAKNYSIRVGANSGTITLYPSAVTKIDGAIYLATGKQISVTKRLDTNITGTVTVEPEADSSGTIIATCSSPLIATQSVGKLIVNGVAAVRSGSSFLVA